MKLYAFEELDADLPLLPLAARRALDLAGVHLGLGGYRTLPVEARLRLAELGSESTVDTGQATHIAQTASPPGRAEAPLSDPPSHAPPASLLDALGGLPLSDKVWQALTPIDRYALAKLARRGASARLVRAYEEIVGASALSTHLSPGGGVRMVDVSDKPATKRRAVAESWVTMSADAFERLASSTAPKGDVLGTARIAGILAAKRTSDLIPLCHPLALTKVEVAFELRPKEHALQVLTTVEVRGPTGVEMEALTGASVAALTVYDMLKGVDRAMTLGPTRLLSKSGGASGDYRTADPGDDSPTIPSPALEETK